MSKRVIVDYLKAMKPLVSFLGYTAVSESLILFLHQNLEKKSLIVLKDTVLQQMYQVYGLTALVHCSWFQHLVRPHFQTKTSEALPVAQKKREPDARFNEMATMLSYRI
jgi:hypothetical protein